MFFLLALGLLALASRRPFRVDLAAEASGCAFASRTQPASYAGRRQGTTARLEWLARVAFRHGYRTWPNDDDSVQLERLAQIVICISQTVRPM